MNKKPVILRIIIALLIVGVFAASMYPLGERDFFSTFLKMVKDPGSPDVVRVMDKAKQLKAEGKEEFDASALLQAANQEGIYLPDLMKKGKLENNGDAIGAVRKEAGSSIRLGLDLAGGVEFMLKLVSPDATPAVGETPEEAAAREARYADQMNNFDQSRDLIIDILGKRLIEQGINECEITPNGAEFIALRAPVVSKEEKLKLAALVGMSAKLRFHLVHADNAKLVDQYLALTPEDRAKFVPPAGYELKESVEFSGRDQASRQAIRNYVFIQKRWEMDGQGITGARVQQNPQTHKRTIGLSFDANGTRRFAEVTRNNIRRRLAIVLDDKLYCAPTINDAIENGNAEISGEFSQEEAKQIADALSSGSIPFVIEHEAMFDMDPTLGRENVRNGIIAGGIALLLVALFIGWYYLRAGLVAVFALSVNVVLILGALAAFNATLTLPGIAGIILTIGMAVDANVLIFERIREELSLGKELSEAIRIGYAKASSAVLDSNITTLFTGIILYSVGTGAVKGFAVTLCIGIITSVFCALFLTRLVFDVISRVFNVKQMKMHAFLSKPHLRFMAHRRVFYAVSIVLIIGSIITMTVRGKELLSIDFTGGTQIAFGYAERIAPAALEKSLKTMGYDGVKVTYKNNPMDETERKLEILIRDDVKSGAADGVTSGEIILARLNAEYPAAKLTGGDENAVGSLVGATFSRSAIYAILLSFVVMVLYISFRYEFGYGMAAIMALIHDVIISMGVFALCSREVSLPVVAAVLTVIGYSLNNTIVVFDRIREVLQLEPNRSYSEVVDLSINQTLSRTVLTSVTTLMVLVILFFFGGISINDFVLVMLTGVIVGTYSSICIASPIVASWHKRIGDQRRNAAALKTAN
ncbi:MAG: protein translocase subunit SecD [Victivallaceae bacterium]|nr:protein translocase subunit SecD [Victivallaceae bacterium]